MNDEQKQMLEDLFQEFMALPDTEYPWTEYEKLQLLKRKKNERKETNDEKDKEKEDPKIWWANVVYGKDYYPFFPAGQDCPKENPFNDEIVAQLKNYENNPENEQLLNNLFEKFLTPLFNTGRNPQIEYKARKNRLAILFSNKTTFTPNENDFKKTLKRIKDLFGKDIEGKTWFEGNKELIEYIIKIISSNDTTNNLVNNAQLDSHKDSDFVYRAFPTWLYWAKDRLFPTDSNPNVIYYGAPGTGKTYIVKNYLKSLFPDEKSYKEHVRWVQFHPSFSYEDFIEGIKPVGIDKITKSVNLKLVNGVFKKHCIDAKKKPEENFYFVADEINRANISAVFGETLSLLEASYRDDGTGENLIETQYSELEKQLDKEEQKEICYDIAKPENDEQLQGDSESNSNGKNSQSSTDSGNDSEKMLETSGKFGIPKNIYFIGMMNDVDKSIDAFDLALRRRFKWIRMDCDYSVIKKLILKEITDEKNVNEFIINCAKLNYFISGRDPKQYKGLGEIELKEEKNDSTKTVKKEIEDSVSRSLKMGSSYEFGHSNFLKIKDICHQNQIKKEHYEELFIQFLQPTLKEYLRSSCSEDKIDDELENAKVIFATGKEKKDEQKK